MAIRAFTPEQHAESDERLARTNFVLAELMKEVRLLRQDVRHQQTSSSPILPSVETSTPAPLAASSALPPPTSWNPYNILLRAEDVGFFDPNFKAEQEHGNTTPDPVVNAGKNAYHLDVFVFVERFTSGR